MEGILYVTIVEGKDFAPRDKTGFSDPFCVMTVNGYKHEQTTKVINQTNNPKFNESFKIKIVDSHEVKYEKKGELIVEVWDWDRLSLDDFVGRAIIPMSSITETIQQSWYSLQSKPHFEESVTGEIFIKTRIEWKAIPVQTLSSVSRIQQKVGAKLSQISRVGADIIGKKVDNLVSWSSRTNQIWSRMKHLKPPKFGYCREVSGKYKDSTMFDKEELELLFYAFRSFCYPNETMNREVFCRVFPDLDGSEIVFALFNAFNIDPLDDLKEIDINFGEFVQSLSHVTRGNPYQRLNMVARFYETAGLILKTRFTVLSRALINLLNAPYTEEDIEKFTKQIFGEHDHIQMSKFLMQLQMLDTDNKKIKLNNAVNLDEAESSGIGHCFGLFHYMYVTTIELIEQMINGIYIKPEKEGFLLKKSEYFFYLQIYWFVLRDGFIYYYRDPSDEFPARVVFLEVDAEVENVTDFEIADSGHEGGAGGRTRSNSNAKNPPKSTSFATNTLKPSPSTNFSLSPSPSSQFISSSSKRSSLNPTAGASLSASLSASLYGSSTPSSSVSSIHSDPSQLALTVPITDSDDLVAIAMHAEGTAHINASNTSLHTQAARNAATSLLNVDLAVFSARDALLESSAAAEAAARAAQAFANASRIAETAATAVTATTGNAVAVVGTKSTPQITLEKTAAATTAATAYAAAQRASEIAQAYASAAQAAAAAAASAAMAWAAAAQAEQIVASIPKPPPMPTKLLSTPPPRLREFVKHKVETKLQAITHRSPALSANAPTPPPPPPVSPKTAARMSKQIKLENKAAKPSTDKKTDCVPTKANTFKIRAGPYTMILAAKNEAHKQKWLDRVNVHVRAGAENPNGSFAPVRTNTAADFYVDGHDYYRAVEEAIKGAREQIFITDWFLSPEVYLNRNTESGAFGSRLDILLTEKATAGVKIYVMVWNETKLATNLNSERVKSELEGRHKNISVICHPILLMRWSHHQKTVIIDQDVAFLGGLDLCFGRYDTTDHPLGDPHAKLFPGKDYYNPSRGGEFDGLDNPWKDLIARARVPRMPWHDVSVKVEGYAARDVAKNFIQRWNHHRDAIQMSSRLLTPKSALWPFKDTKTCQILRSLSEWSGQGCNYTESSIHASMVTSIQQAKHFIYIENQYFISSTAGGKVRNEIAMALLQRIRTAIIERKIRSLAYPNFRVIVVLPVHPEGTYKDSTAIRYIMKWQYATICRGGKSILEVLQKEFPEENLNQYISFHALRNHAILEGMVVTEQIYVHTKLLIIDDKRIIVGSANINDRSLAGDRDSEIAVVIDDEDLISSKMADMAGRMAFNLRTALWREHLGLEESDTKLIMDPIQPESFEMLWQGTARNNTALYTQVFGILEGDTVESIRDIQHQRKPLATPETVGVLNEIKGHLVDYPLNFLSTSLAESFASMDIMLAGDEVFQ